MGRAPDHVASCISGMYMGLDVFEAYDGSAGQALADYYRYARDNDLYLTYVIINPQADRSKSASQQTGRVSHRRRGRSGRAGVTVRGAKMLATGGIMANEVLVTCIQPLQPGDEKYAVSFAIPMNAKGLKILSRKSYEEEAPSVFDNPLSSRFDENDAVLYLRRRQGAVGAGLRRSTASRCARGSSTRRRRTSTRTTRRWCGCRSSCVSCWASRTASPRSTARPASPRSARRWASSRPKPPWSTRSWRPWRPKARGTGRYFVPDRHTLYAAQTLTQKLYATVLNTLRELAGGGMIMLPSSLEDFRNPEIAALIEKTQQSPAASATDRVKFYKLAWDAVGSEFASRHAQYEMFYAGASFVTAAHSYRTYDWPAAARALDDMLESYNLADELDRSA